MNGTVTIRYRPIETMDRLHVLLTGAATLEDSSFDTMATLFSMPSRIIKKECAVLEGYGIGRISDECFRLTDRGAVVLSTWNYMGKTDSLNVETSAEAWMLGPGNFCVPGTIRGFQGCTQQAEKQGINTLVEATAFIGRQHKSEITVSGFLDTASQAWNNGHSNWTGHGEAIIAKVGIADSNHAIDSLRGLLLALFDLKNDESDEFLDDKNSLLGTFDDQCKLKRRDNKQLAIGRGACESLLIRDWLSRAADHLLERFEDEPGAFAFTSSVPVAVEADKPKTRHQPDQTPRQQPQKSEGFLRSLFRWFTG
jgi:hypothetical protein